MSNIFTERHDAFQALMVGTGGAASAPPSGLATSRDDYDASHACGGCDDSAPCSSCGGSEDAPHAAVSAYEWGMMATEGVTDQFWRASLVAETMRSAPSRDNTSVIWGLADRYLQSVQATYLLTQQDETSASLARSMLHDSGQVSGAVGHTSLDGRFQGCTLNQWLEPDCEQYPLTIDGIPQPLCYCRVWRWVEKRDRRLWICFERIHCFGPGECDMLFETWWNCTPKEPPPPWKKPWWWDVPPCPDTQAEAKAMVQTKSWGEDCENPLHPGTCYRNVVSSGPGQQCCYDKNGILDTDSHGAGTPDRAGSCQRVDDGGCCKTNGGWDGFWKMMQHTRDDEVQNWWVMTKAGDYGWVFDYYLVNWPPYGGPEWRRVMSELYGEDFVSTYGYPLPRPVPAGIGILNRTQYVPGYEVEIEAGGIRTR